MEMDTMIYEYKGISNQEEAKIYIFDRYGKLLKEIRPSGRGWTVHTMEI